MLANYFEPIPFMRDETSLPARNGARSGAGKRAFASSGQQGEHRAELAFDDNIATRWQGSAEDNQWLAVDLGGPQKIGRVHFGLGNRLRLEYRIEVSDDGQNWRPVYETSQSQGGEEDITFAPVEARYVRMFAVKRGTKFGASLEDFEVRAPK